MWPAYPTVYEVARISREAMCPLDRHPQSDGLRIRDSHLIDGPMLGADFQAACHCVGVISHQCLDKVWPV